MSLRPFFPYYGSKWSLAPLYPAPRHDRVIEPFAGSACYSLHHHTKSVVLIERDPVIAELWRWLLRVTPEEVLALPDLEPGQSTDDLELCSAAKNLIGLWLNSGVSSPRKRLSTWRAEQPKPGCQWDVRTRRRIARQLEAIRHWTVIHGDMAGRLCPLVLTPGEPLQDVRFLITDTATWFVDPPYQGRPGSHYRFGSKLIDYAELAAWCQGLPGQVVVCEQLGADWLPFERLGRVQGQRGASTEMVWYSDRCDPMKWRQPELFGGDNG